MKHRFLKIEEVEQLTGLSRSSIKRLEDNPKSGFPSRIALTVGRIAWDEQAVLAWMNNVRQQSTNDRGSSSEMIVALE